MSDEIINIFCEASVKFLMGIIRDFHVSVVSSWLLVIRVNKEHRQTTVKPRLNLSYYKQTQNHRNLSTVSSLKARKRRGNS